MCDVPQLPNLCESEDVCKLEVNSQGQCLEYNYDYDNGFAIGSAVRLDAHALSHWLSVPLFTGPSVCMYADCLHKGLSSVCLSSCAHATLYSPHMIPNPMLTFFSFPYFPPSVSSLLLSI